mmetsp:Transcript_22573/g.49249  ORF Transcript_22573/g.49249 Transcript_22573/m.49249 type:complete len:360 (-) Transcript_22573:145-1224(-)
MSDDIVITYGSPDITRYECQDVYSKNADALNNFNLPYAYEMFYDCSLEAEDGMTFIQGSLLHKAKQEYLKTGSACKTPTSFWFAAIDSQPEDKLVNTMDCSHFDTTNQPSKCCSVVQGNMTFVELVRVPNATAMWEWSRQQFSDQGGNAVHAWAGNEFTTHYIGTDTGYTEGTGSDELNPANNDGELPPENTQKDDRDITGAGVAMVLFLILCMGAVISVIWVRRRRLGRAQDYGIAVTKSQDAEDLDLREHDELSESEDIPGWIEPRRAPGAEPRAVPTSYEKTQDRRSKVPDRERMQNMIENDDGDDDDEIHVRAPFRDSNSGKNARQQRNYDFDFEEGAAIIPAHPNEYMKQEELI